MVAILQRMRSAHCHGDRGLLDLQFRTEPRSGQVQAGESTAAPSERIKLRRETVKRFWCPVASCKAGPAQPCVEDTGEVRDKLHRERVEKAERLMTAALRQYGRLPAIAS